jgi:ubiquinone/menaquinone biosynthesis C-methylase UbiE
MTKSRIPETDHGIQGKIAVAQYDQMQRSFRDKGWMETPALLKYDITNGQALEIGHGPGYLGLEWLKQTEGTTLVGLDISPDMGTLAQRNAQEYGLTARAQYRLGNCDHLPFDDNTFDAVFTNGSLHEWANPRSAFDEIWRVLKPGGHYFISDLRRDMSFLMRAFLWLSVRPTAMRPGLLTSVGAAYTPQELQDLIAKTRLKDGTVVGNLIGVEISGVRGFTREEHRRRSFDGCDDDAVCAIDARIQLSVRLGQIPLLQFERSVVSENIKPSFR